MRMMRMTTEFSLMKHRALPEIWIVRVCPAMGTRKRNDANLLVMKHRAMAKNWIVRVWPVKGTR